MLCKVLELKVPKTTQTHKNTPKTHDTTWYDSNNMIKILYRHVMDSTRVGIWLGTF